MSLIFNLFSAELFREKTEKYGGLFLFSFRREDNLPRSLFSIYWGNEVGFYIDILWVHLILGNE